MINWQDQLNAEPINDMRLWSKQIYDAKLAMVHLAMS